MRSTKAAGDVSASGRHRRTRATSRVTRGSGDSRMSISASPSVSMARTVAGAPRRRAWSVRLLISSSGRPARLGAMVAKNVLRRCSTRSRASWRGSWPAAVRSATPTSARPASRSHSPSTISSTGTPCSSTPPAAATWSRADRASRTEPLPRRATSSMASGATSRPASDATQRRCSASTSAWRSRNSKCWVRLRIVGSTFWGSVVASTNTTWPGGSSSVLSKALDAAAESMCTSSTMYTFHRPGVPRAARATRSRMASTPLFDAASSSWTSSEVPAATSTQDWQTPHGSPSLGEAQFRALARMRADDVFPVPRGPLKR